MAGRVELEKQYKRMLRMIGPSAKHPGKHFKAANELIVSMADVGLDPTELSERLYFLTEGYTEKDKRSGRERFRTILKGAENV